MGKSLAVADNPTWSRLVLRKSQCEVHLDVPRTHHLCLLRQVEQGGHGMQSHLDDCCQSIAHVVDLDPDDG